MPPILIAIDQGTTNSKAVALGPDGQVVAGGAERVTISFPRPGWAESDPLEIWRSVRVALDRCVTALPVGASIVGLGISNQRETVVAWDARTGRPLGPAVSWQCTRGTLQCARWRTPTTSAMVRARTGLDLDPMFSASKMAWLLDNIVDGHQRAADGAIRLGTIDTWLLHCLSDGRQFATDLTNASRTLACNINDLDWDPELLDLFAIPRVALAQVLGSSDDFGEVTLGPLAGVAIRSMIGDSHASLVGHGALRTGSMKATFGTGTSVMAPIGNQTSIPTLSGAIAWSRGSSTGKPSVVRAIEGNIYATGAALEWTAALLGLPEGAAGLEALAVRARADSEAELVPAFSGLGAPHWNATARGIMTGLTRADGPAEVARAAIDAVAHQVADVTDLVVDLIGSSVHALAVDGGAIHSDLLAQRVADLTGLDVWRNEQSDLSAVGAGLLAGWQLGVWADEEAIVALPRPGARFSPTGSGDERAAQRDRWRRAVDRALSMPR